MSTPPEPSAPTDPAASFDPHRDAGYTSAEGQKRMKQRATLVGILVGLAQIVLPIVIIVAAVASMLSACKSILRSPDIDASGAALHDRRIYYTVWQLGDDEQDTEGALVLYSVDPADAEPRKESALGAEFRRFERRRLLSHAGRLLIFNDDTVASFDAGKLSWLVDENADSSMHIGRRRPFSWDGHPAVAVAEVTKPERRDSSDTDDRSQLDELNWARAEITTRTLVDGSWSDHTVVFATVPPDAQAQSLQLVRPPDGGWQGFVSTDEDELFAISVADSAARATKLPRRLSKEVGDFAATLLDGKPAVFFLTKGPDIVDRLDALEDDDVELPPTKLLGMAPDGQTLFSETVDNADELAALTLDANTVALVTEHGEGLKIHTLRNGKLDSVSSSSRPSWETAFFAELVGLGLLWLFGDALLTLFGAWLLGRAMRVHRVEQYTTTDPPAVHGSLPRRVLAKAIDSGLLVAVAVPVALLLAPHGFDSEAAVYACVIPLWLLMTFAEGRWGVSPGKWLMRIRVLGTDLRPCGMWRAFVRQLLFVVDGILGGLVGVLVVALSSHWQRIGDMAAKTVVVQARGRP